MLKLQAFLVALFAVFSAALLSARSAAEQPLLTLDEFFDSVSFHSVEVSPDGLAVVIETVRADWENNRYRSDLWIYRQGRAASGRESLVQLTRSGHDRNPQWSPDSRWIAFLSDRKPVGPVSKPPAVKDPESQGNAALAKQEDEPPAQLYVIGIDGGEEFPVTSGDDDVHAFAWAKDSRAIYFAAPLPKAQQQEAYQKEWKDVIRFRESEREDLIRSVDVSPITTRPPHSGQQNPELSLRPEILTRTPYRVKQLIASPDGRRLAFQTESRSQRQESLYAYGIYLVDLPGGQVRLLSRTQAIYEAIRWAPNNRDVFFSFVNGSVEGPYQDAQPRVYSVDMMGEHGSAGGRTTRWASRFPGALGDFTVTSSGALLASGRIGTEMQPYTQTGPATEFVKRMAWPGSYEKLSAAQGSLRVAFVYSSTEKPPEVYFADNLDSIDRARPITAFNQLLTQRRLPQGKPYRWTADDGTTVEGMLIYPPGRFGVQHLPMLTFIHGGPEDADGNRFEADWYQWSVLAANVGWLVFEPNYRGSVGYGDAFALGIIPHLVSRPGKDILEGVDALVKDGIADPAHLTVGGYSYGGYMTNWLITQTTRFKAAVTGAGAVEHVCNWGNDDTSLDDAYFLGGLPWEAQRNYNEEAAIWQFGKVTTPTHIVAGANDIRVYLGEAYLLERALFTRDIPHTLLIFPGEGHELDKNPWHGKIKVREELKWLAKYGS
jgi:dipeptidyl aminopeptidase/acylaminoacyl peptidase